MSLFREAAEQQYYVELAVETPARDQTENISFQLDSGATCSTMKLSDYEKLSDKPPQPSSTRLKLYNGTLIHPVGLLAWYVKSRESQRKSTSRS